MNKAYPICWNCTHFWALIAIKGMKVWTSDVVQIRVSNGTGRPFPAFCVLLGNWFCPGTSRDRGVCPGTFAPALVPGQRDTGTRKFFCPGTKGQRDVPSCGNPNTNWNLTSNQLLPHCRLDRLTKLVRNVYSRGRLVVGGSLTANQSHVDNFCNLLKAWTATNK